jgi:hypothetical protein
MGIELQKLDSLRTKENVGACEFEEYFAKVGVL